jgi:hypothetical protein
MQGSKDEADRELSAKKFSLSSLLSQCSAVLPSANQGQHLFQANRSKRTPRQASNDGKKYSSGQYSKHRVLAFSETFKVDGLIRHRPNFQCTTPEPCSR